MLKTLLRIRMRALFHSIFRSGRRAKRTGPAATVGFGLLMVYVLGCFLFMFGTMFLTLCEPLVKAGLGWYYFGFAGLMTFALCFIGNVFATQTQLYDAKDNELLLSMPIAPRNILGSRMAALLLMDLGYSAMVLLPAFVVYAMSFSVGAAEVLFFAAGLLLLPLLAQAFTCIIAWLISAISSHLRNKNVISIVLSVGFLCAYFYVFSQINTLLQKMVENGANIAAAFRRVALPMYWFGRALAERSGIDLLLFAAIALGCFALIYIILTRSFISIATTKRGLARIKYTQKELRSSNLRSALLGKELTHFWNNPMYVMNGGVGELLLIIFSVVLLFKRESILATFGMLGDISVYIGPLLCTALCGINSMSLIAAPSISLEGKNLWIAQSFPIPPKEILLAKARMQMTVCIPATLVASVLCLISLPCNWVQVIAVLVVPQIFNVFIALMGVAVGLQFPKFDYISETAAVKSSMSTFVCMMVGFAAVLVPVLLYLMLLSKVIPAMGYVAIWAAVFALAAWVLYRYLCRGGAKKFMLLQSN